MIVSTRQRSRFNHRRGALTVEALMIITFLLLVTIAIIEFGTAITVQQAVTQAAIAGAREASIGGGPADVESTVECVLAPYGITVEDEDSDAVIIIENPDSGTETRGDFPDGSGLTCSTPAEPATISTGYVRVTVCVSCTAQPFLGQLEDFGLSFMGSLMTRSAVVKIEP